MFLSADPDPVPCFEADGQNHDFGFPRLLSPGFEIIEDSVVPNAKLPRRHGIRPHSLSTAGGHVGLVSKLVVHRVHERCPVPRRQTAKMLQCRRRVSNPINQERVLDGASWVSVFSIIGKSTVTCRKTFSQIAAYRPTGREAAMRCSRPSFGTDSIGG